MTAVGTIIKPEVAMITTSVLAIAPGEAHSGEPSVDVFVQFCQAEENEGWHALLYDSLSDYVHHWPPPRHHLSLFKLATSVELYADRLFERYLRRCGISHEKVLDSIVSSVRSWPLKYARVGEVVSAVLESTEQRRYHEARNDFDRNVRRPRNGFAHGHATGWAHDQATLAYQAAFDILWVLDRLDRALA